MNLTHRPRRLRQQPLLRRMVREVEFKPASLVYPLFVVPGDGVKREISSMPGNFHWSLDRLVDECKLVRDLGISAVMLFGLPESKDETASGAWSDDGIVQRAVRALKQDVPGLAVFTDVCLCEYTSHGHCGMVEPSPSETGEQAGVNFRVVNDRSVEIIARTAVSHARAGADMVTPSDMMDGRVGAIRAALDAADFVDMPIMAHAAKFASGFYGPFREAAGSTPQFGDRRSYQMDPANAREAMFEMELDYREGADILMVKPALAYLDVLHAARERFDIPLAAYQVSGEFSMIMAAAERGWVDLDRIIDETLTAIRRAGADIILTYFAKRAAGWKG